MFHFLSVTKPFTFSIIDFSLCPLAPLNGKTDRVTLKNAQSFTRQKPEGGVVFQIHIIGKQVFTHIVTD